MTASAGPVLTRLYEAFGDRVAFITLYVREAHPGSYFPQPQTFEEKLEHARVYKERDDIPWPVAVDDLDGHLHRALNLKSSAAYIMNLDGRVAFRALWSNDEPVLRQGLQTIANQPRQVIGQRESRVIPMVTGMGTMWDILEFAGGYAKSDVMVQTPPIYAMVRVADLFDPLLQPLGRGMAAMALGIVGLVAMVTWLRRAGSR